MKFCGLKTNKLMKISLFNFLHEDKNFKMVLSKHLKYWEYWTITNVLITYEKWSEHTLVTV